METYGMLTGPAQSAAGPTPRFVGQPWFCTQAGNGFLVNTLYTHNGTSWVAAVPAANAFKELGFATANANQTITSTASPGTDLTNLSVTVTPDGTHPVLVELTLPAVFGSAVANTTMVFAIQKGGVVVQAVKLTDMGALGSPYEGVVVARYRDAAPSGSTTYKASAWSGAANTITIEMAAAQLGMLTVTQVQT